MSVRTNQRVQGQVTVASRYRGNKFPSQIWCRSRSPESTRYGLSALCGDPQNTRTEHHEVRTGTLCQFVPEFFGRIRNSYKTGIFYITNYNALIHILMSKYNPVYTAANPGSSIYDSNWTRWIPIKKQSAFIVYPSVNLSKHVRWFAVCVNIYRTFKSPYLFFHQRV